MVNLLLLGTSFPLMVIPSTKLSKENWKQYLWLYKDTLIVCYGMNINSVYVYVDLCLVIDHFEDLKEKFISSKWVVQYYLCLCLCVCVFLFFLWFFLYFPNNSLIQFNFHEDQWLFYVDVSNVSSSRWTVLKQK